MNKQSKWVKGGRLFLSGMLTLMATLVGGGTLGAEFPSHGILPKTEIGAARFLETHPGFDGRGVVVAVFDTGVDPGAPGLQRTSDGRPKIIDVIDATGSGDVDTSTVVTATNGGFVGLTGRRLRTGDGWRNPTGRYHLGLKRGYELFPGPLVDRVKEKRRERWDAAQRQLEAEMRRQIATHGETEPDPSAPRAPERKDLETRLEQLLALQQAYEDPGPVYDCVVFHDGNVWRVVLDADEDGDLGEEKALTHYRLERGYATFDDETLLNFAVNIYDDGRLLSIVVDSGMHGTHVAGIVAACFPDEPEHSGIAPGAQIVSVKIGDSRLGGMETASALVRGLAAVREHPCDVINLSYGEPTPRPNQGRLIRLLSEIVNDDGVIFVASAGNDGPALSTVGAPGGTTSALIGVGAYLSPAMMEAGYSMRSGLPETQYTFSGRGPTFDGDLGVNISAPGGAVSPVPNWTLQRHQLANGTSMASPNAAGAIALILSGLKAEGLGYSPSMIRRAVENSARPIPGVEVFAQGRGLIQVDHAFEQCLALGRESAAAPRLEVTLPRQRNARGVYLREPEETSRPLDVTVRVSPHFSKSTDNRVKVDYQRRFRLESSAAWIEAPGHLMLAHAGRSFELRIDPTQLDPGVHYAEVTGFDLGDATAGPAFRLPVTVIRPVPVSDSNPAIWTETIPLTAAQLERRFLVVPAGATRAELTVRAGDLDSPRRLIVHALQVLPLHAYTDTQMQRYLTLDSQDDQKILFPVTGGRTLELCLGQSWSSLGEGSYDFTVSFHGVVPAQETVFLDANARVKAVDVTASLGEARLAPAARLRTWRRSITPAKAELQPLSTERDRLTGGKRIHELILSYSFEQDQPGSITPRFPALNGRLYDGEFESQLWMLFDDANQLLAVDDGWDPGAVRLGRGRHLLRFHLRHDQSAWLDQLKELPLLLDQDLDSALEVSCFADPDEALVGGTKFSGRSLAHGERARFFLAAPPLFELTRHAKPGDLLIGTIRYDAAEGGLEHPLICPAPRPVPAKPATDASNDEASLETRLAHARREFEVSQLDPLMREPDSAAFESLAADLESRYPDDLSVPVKRLHRLDDADRGRHLRSVVTAADEILNRVNTDRLAASLGTRPGDDPQEKRDRRELERQRDALVDALYRKGRALAWMELPEERSADDDVAEDTGEPPFEPETIDALFEANYRELSRWVDPASDDHVLLAIRREWRQGRLGEALRLLQGKLISSPVDATLQRKRIQLFEALGWEAWAEHERQWQLVRFPCGYPRF
ncbi:MAG: S8 family serine peptidase [Verrucomicrobia bacterium]|nr:S8 family serine peptidase [Verrucomicrobiota bacterium]